MRSSESRLFRNVCLPARKGRAGRCRPSCFFQFMFYFVTPFMFYLSIDSVLLYRIISRTSSLKSSLRFSNLQLAFPSLGVLTPRVVGVVLAPVIEAQRNQGGDDAVENDNSVCTHMVFLPLNDSLLLCHFLCMNVDPNVCRNQM